MPRNERLRRAMAQAQVDVDDVSRAAEVDPKTVQRWLAGRMPHPRHRWTVAKALSQDEGYLWPSEGQILPPGAGTTAVEISPALLVHRPDGTPVAPGPELDGMARHVTDIVIPTLLRGIALPDGIPAHIDLNDNGETFAERLAKGGTTRAHVRARPIMEAALVEAEARDWHFPAIDDEEE